MTRVGKDTGSLRTSLVHHPRHFFRRIRPRHGRRHARCCTVAVTHPSRKKSCVRCPKRGRRRRHTHKWSSSPLPGVDTILLLHCHWLSARLNTAIEVRLLRPEPDATPPSPTRFALRARRSNQHHFPLLCLAFLLQGHDQSAGLPTVPGAP